jgi:hypothetical protein
MVDVKTEGQHAGEFIVSEANGTLSREVGALKSGEVVKDGQAVDIDTGKLIAAVDSAVGIVVGDHDASGGEKAGVVYIARLAEVKDSLLTLTDESTEASENGVKAALDALFIVRR